MKRLLSVAASAAILFFVPQTAHPGALYDAVITSDFPKVSRYVASGFVEDTGDLGTALNAAIALGNSDISVLLIDHGADLEATRGASGMRPLHMAASYRQSALVS